MSTVRFTRKYVQDPGRARLVLAMSSLPRLDFLKSLPSYKNIISAQGKQLQLNFRSKGKDLGRWFSPAVLA